MRQGRSINDKPGKVSARWYLFYYEDKKRREMSLGKYPALSLSEARVEARKQQADIANGVDPIAERKKDEEPDLKDAIELFLKNRAFNTDRTKNRWHYCLTVHAKPLHHKKASVITMNDIHALILPLWTEKHLSLIHI